MRLYKNRKIIFIALLLVLALLNGGVFAFSAKYVDIFLQNRLNLASADLGNRISSRVTGYSDTLYSAASLFTIKDKVTPEDWHAFLSNTGVFSRRPGLDVIGYAPVISSGQEGNLQNQAASLGIANYQVKPAHSSQIEAPVLYLEPHEEGYENVLGFNLYSEPERKAALDYAADNNSIAITDIITPVADKNSPDKTIGLIMVLPLYKTGADISTVEQRRANLVGFITAGIRPEDFMEGIVLQVVPGIKFQVFDNSKKGELSADNMIYNSGDEQILNPEFSSPYYRVEQISLPNTVWYLRLVVVPETEFARLVEAAPWLILILGVIISILLFFTVLRIYDRYEAMRLSAKNSAERLIAEDAVVDAYQDGIIATDPHGLVMIFNKKAEQVLGYMEHQVLRQKNLTSMITTECLQKHSKRVAEEMNTVINQTFDCLITKSLIDGQDQLDLEFITRAGQKLAISVRIRPLYDPSNFLLGYQFIFNDGRKL